MFRGVGLPPPAASRKGGSPWGRGFAGQSRFHFPVSDPSRRRFSAIAGRSPEAFARPVFRKKAPSKAPSFFGRIHKALSLQGLRRGRSGLQIRHSPVRIRSPPPVSASSALSRRYSNRSREDDAVVLHAGALGDAGDLVRAVGQLVVLHDQIDRRGDLFVDGPERQHEAARQRHHLQHALGDGAGQLYHQNVNAPFPLESSAQPCGPFGRGRCARFKGRAERVYCGGGMCAPTHRVRPKRRALAPWEVENKARGGRMTETTVPRSSKTGSWNLFARRRVRYHGVWSRPDRGVWQVFLAGRRWSLSPRASAKESRGLAAGCFGRRDFSARSPRRPRSK